MYIVNPIGRNPVNGNFIGVTPRSCICHGEVAYSVLETFGQGSNCACSCIPERPDNYYANTDLARSY